MWAGVVGCPSPRLKVLGWFMHSSQVLVSSGPSGQPQSCFLAKPQLVMLAASMPITGLLSSHMLFAATSYCFADGTGGKNCSIQRRHGHAFGVAGNLASMLSSVHHAKDLQKLRARGATALFTPSSMDLPLGYHSAFIGVRLWSVWLRQEGTVFDVVLITVKVLFSLSQHQGTKNMRGLPLDSF